MSISCTSNGSEAPATNNAVTFDEEDTVRRLPYPKDMAGFYNIATTSLEALKLPAFTKNKVVFNLQADSTFQLENFPMYRPPEDDITQYELINATGEWSIGSGFGNPYWSVLMHFDTIRQASSGKLLGTNITRDGFYNIQGSVPPHSIHIPLFANPSENKKGIVLQKK
jgi:hypothetical protein